MTSRTAPAYRCSSTGKSLICQVYYMMMWANRTKVAYQARRERGPAHPYLSCTQLFMCRLTSHLPLATSYPKPLGFEGLFFIIVGAVGLWAASTCNPRAAKAFMLSFPARLLLKVLIVLIHLGKSKGNVEQAAGANWLFHAFDVLLVVYYFKVRVGGFPAHNTHIHMMCSKVMYKRRPQLWQRTPLWRRGCNFLFIKHRLLRTTWYCL